MTLRAGEQDTNPTWNAGLSQKRVEYTLSERIPHNMVAFQNVYLVLVLPKKKQTNKSTLR